LLNNFLAFSQTEKESINDLWKFNKSDISNAGNLDFDDAVWQNVNLPHTSNTIGTCTTKQHYRGIGWYRKALNLTNKYAD